MQQFTSTQCVKGYAMDSLLAGFAVSSWPLVSLEAFRPETHTNKPRFGSSRVTSPELQV